MVFVALAREIVPIKRSLARPNVQVAMCSVFLVSAKTCVLSLALASLASAIFSRVTVRRSVNLTSQTQGSTLSDQENRILASFTAALGKNGKRLL